MIVQIAVAAGAALAVLVILGQLARARLRRRFGPTGRFVDMGGYRLHVMERGSGPTIVLEGGTWTPGLAWEPVARELAAMGRIVTYDRAGLGWSDRSPRPRTAEVMADELHALLKRAMIPGPYVLVGHSFGGTIARVFAHTHADEVSGLVLLDGAHEDQFARAPQRLREFNDLMSRRMPAMFRLFGVLVRSGMLALRPSLVPAEMGPLPPDILATIRGTIAADPKVVAAMAAEMASLEAGNVHVRELEIRSLGDLPLVVVSHGRPEGVPPALGPKIAAEYERTWQALQVEQAGLSSRSRRVVAANVGHNIPTEAPSIVVDAVRDVLEMGSHREALAS